MQLSYDYAKDRASICLCANYESYLSIGRIKQYARMTEPYGGTENELNCEMNVVAGLVNLHLMKTLHRGSPKLRRRFLG